MTNKEKLNEMTKEFMDKTGYSFVDVCRIVGGNIWWNIIENM